MMLFQRPNGGSVALTKKVVKDLTRFTQTRSSDPESGGILLGRELVDSSDIVIDKITEPTREDKRSRFSFFRTKKTAQKKVDRLWKKSRGTCVYLGEWHTHPEDFPTPSGTIDLPEWARIAKEAHFEQDFLLFLIVGRKRINAWELSKVDRTLSKLELLT